VDAAAQRIQFLSLAFFAGIVIPIAFAVFIPAVMLLSGYSLIAAPVLAGVTSWFFAKRHGLGRGAVWSGLLSAGITAPLVYLVLYTTFLILVGGGFGAD
jgi:hypothetical protein